MKIFNRYQFIIWLLVLPLKGFSQQVITNPLINHDFPDPTIIMANGKYYAYATNSVVKGKYMHVQMARSADMINWEDIGDALPGGAAWASKDYWAPYVLYDKDLHKYVLFYSAQSKAGDTGKCLGVAFADSPEGPFIDKGTPLVCGAAFINIDPFAFKDPKTGRKLLYWGSGFEPIKVQELNNDWQSFKAGSKPTAVVFPRKEKRYTKLIEGAWVDYNKGYYYLYYSGDNCCGPQADYAVLVARSSNAEGPFITLGESNGSGKSAILEEDSKWVAPGHNSIFRDKKGNIFIAYHAIRKQPSGHIEGPRVMLIDYLQYKNGWPLVIK